MFQEIAWSSETLKSNPRSLTAASASNPAVIFDEVFVGETRIRYSKKLSPIETTSGKGSKRRRRNDGFYLDYQFFGGESVIMFFCILLLCRQ